MVATFYPQKPTAMGDDANDTLSKGKIGLAFKNAQAASLSIVDFTIVPAAKGNREPYTKAGDAAKVAEAANASSSTTARHPARPLHCVRGGGLGRARAVCEGLSAGHRNGVRRHSRQLRTAPPRGS